MHGPIYRFLAADHARLDELLRRAVATPNRIDPEFYAAFRAGLLKHIGMEEKILLREAARLRDGKPLAIAEKLRQAPEVHVAAHSDGQFVAEATCRALARAGFDVSPKDLQASE